MRKQAVQMGYEYEVGDIVKLKTASCGSFEWGNSARGGGFQVKMHRLRASGDACAASGGKKARRPAQKFIKFYNSSIEKIDKSLAKYDEL